MTTQLGLPPPSILLGHPKFSSWYPGQEYALSQVLDWLSGPETFMCASMPTGSGKSLLAVLSSHLSNRRVCFNTVTKGLQAQLTSDFSQVGMIDIRGQNSYPCILQPEQDLTVDQGPCHSGISCTYRESGCLYYDQLTKVKSSRSIVTNYAYWLAQTNHSDGVGPITLLVCDEAHLAFQALESYLKVDFSNNEIQTMGIPSPINAKDIEDWRGWALLCMAVVAENLQQVKNEVQELKDTGGKISSSLLREVRHWSSLLTRCESIRAIKGHWIYQQTARGVTFTPVWPGKDYSKVLFQNVSKVLIMSATLTEKTVASLGIKEGDYKFLETPSYFPPQNSPVFHVKSVRLNHKTDDMEMRYWVSRIDQIISRRLDRKGIIFTVSYDRRNLLMSTSYHKNIMQSHAREDIYQAVAKFKASPAPAILVSPAISSGWDFPDAECEYVIVGKLPYPDSRDPVVKARQEDDNEWTSFLAMETLVQVSGRGSRSETDKCETIIMDNNWTWFWKRYQKFAPQYFKDRVIRNSFDIIPDPLI